MSPRKYTRRMATRAGITLGRPRATLDAASFAITEVSYAPNDRYGWHAHESPYLLLTCSGAFSEEASLRSVQLSSGGVTRVPGGQRHRDVIGPGGVHGVLVTLKSFGREPSRWSAHCGDAVSRSMIALVAAVASGGASELLAIEEHLLGALDPGVEEHTQDTQTVTLARDFIEAHAEEPLRLTAIAHRFGVTAAHLSRTFRRVSGRTMSAYLRSVRASRAATLLTASRTALAEIALASGFADQSHLCRVFKSAYGMSPMRYRALMTRSNLFKT